MRPYFDKLYLRTKTIYVLSILATFFVSTVSFAQAPDNRNWLTRILNPVVFKDTDNTELFKIITEEEDLRNFIGDFIQPNEHKPTAMLGITERAPPGALISIGTERGFMSAALNTQVDQLVLVDKYEGVALYNRINIALLRIAQNANDYVYLRKEARSEEVHSRIALDPQQGSSYSLDEVHWFLRRARNYVMNNKILAGNYLNSPLLCNRLINLAKQNALSAYLLDITDISKTKALVHTKLRDSTIAIVDISNTWWASYVGREGIYKFMQGLESNLNDSTVFVLTNSPNYIIGQVDWAYAGFTYKNLKENWQTAGIRFFSDNFLHQDSICTIDLKSCKNLFAN